MIPVCPVCDIALILLEFRGVEIDVCVRCRGAWLDAGELDAILEKCGVPNGIEQGNFSPERIQERKSRPCPRCDVPMELLSQPLDSGQTMHLDRCPRAHGVWFDAGELVALFQATVADEGRARVVRLLQQTLGYDQPKFEEAD